MIQVKMSSQELKHKYNNEKFLFIPNFISPEQAKEFEAETSNWDIRRVTCGFKEISWGEQAIPKQSKLFELFNSESILDLIKLSLDIEKIPDGYSTICWTSRYGEGEYINPHKDASGTTQMILCLDACPKENGGYLMLNLNNQEIALCLQPGDAILFCAADVEHWTTPLKSSATYQQPKRVVAVARYFLDTQK